MIVATYNGIHISWTYIIVQNLCTHAQVMLAASYWSLLAPAIEMAETSGSYGKDGRFAFIPVSVGFVLGAVFVFGADKLLPFLVTLNTCTFFYFFFFFN